MDNNEKTILNSEKTVLNNNEKTVLNNSEKTILNNGRTVIDVRNRPKAAAPAPHSPASPAAAKSTTPPSQLPPEAMKQAVKPGATAAPAAAKATAQKSSKGAVAAGIGAGVGIAGGATAAVVMGMRSDEPLQFETVEDEVLEEVINDPVDVVAEVITNVPLAGGVNEGMSFGEAFAAARAEVGPGGAFMWHGQMYNTYTAAEWNAMSADEQHQYAQAAAGTSTGSYHYSGAQNQMAEVQSEEAHGSYGYTGPGEGGEDNPVVTPDDPIVTPSDPDDVVVLGVAHDEESGINYGVLQSGNEMGMVIDVDGDMVFDYLAVDENRNGDFLDDEDSIYDIREAEMSVADLGGFTDCTDAMPESDDFMADTTDTLM